MVKLGYLVLITLSLIGSFVFLTDVFSEQQTAEEIKSSFTKVCAEAASSEAEKNMCLSFELKAWEQTNTLLFITKLMGLSCLVFLTSLLLRRKFR